MMKLSKILVITAFLISVPFICSKWVLKDAFGPKSRTVEIKIDESITLKCIETYKADIHDVFYDVDFTLEDKTSRTLKLGSGIFEDEHWAKHINLHTIADWLVLPVNEFPYVKFLMTNKLSTIKKDTILSPHNLRHDSLWKAKYNDIPAWTYSGSSKIDSITNDRVYVNYEYRIGDYPPFKFYSQTIEYRLDTITANLTTARVFERHEKHNGS
ncbi:MAG TPA: hypothetical protein VEC36_00165 [Patescibacteria group bacterium]|nr:hypothetical protein [Patescibacteria group bacterium]